MSKEPHNSFFWDWSKIFWLFPDSNWLNFIILLTKTPYPDNFLISLTEWQPWNKSTVTETFFFRNNYKKIMPNGLNSWKIISIMPHTPKIMKNNKIMPRGAYAIYSQEIFKMPTYLKILILRVLLKNVVRPNSKTKKTPTLWPLFMDGVQLPQG